MWHCSFVCRCNTMTKSVQLLRPHEIKINCSKDKQYAHILQGISKVFHRKWKAPIMPFTTCGPSWGKMCTLPCFELMGINSHEILPPLLFFLVRNRVLSFLPVQLPTHHISDLVMPHLSFPINCLHHQLLLLRPEHKAISNYNFTLQVLWNDQSGNMALPWVRDFTGKHAI